MIKFQNLRHEHKSMHSKPQKRLTTPTDIEQYDLQQTSKVC